MKVLHNGIRRSVSCLLIICSLLLFASCSSKGDGKDSKVANTEAMEVETGADKLTESTDTNQDSDVKDSVGKEDMSSKDTKAYAAKYQESGDLASISEVYSDVFRVGVALAAFDIKDPYKAKLVTSQFNSITCENEMKADFTLDREKTLALKDEECPAINMGNADTALTFAKENGLGMRGHTLVWYSQTPRWLFTVGYDDKPDAPYVSREVMLSRMENYIRQVMEYVNTNYPGVIYAWDVVNEAIATEDGEKNGLRIKNNYWYEVIGEDYIEMAFTYARKYAEHEQKLFYNDYGTYEKSKLFAIYKLVDELKGKGLIDGIGMQDHMQIGYPNILDYQYALKKYAELGLEIQITELDIDAPDDTKETQAKLATRYKVILSLLQKYAREGQAKITNVTFWGLTDDRSWLNRADKPSFPLLFDRNLKPKEAFFGALQDESVSSY
ncbi:MAG TPA: endo-1,4-beta-xylanase [Lachnospiraceae bacterium]|nr:endo-1,4-beta-xylanase [Lachnospiraceae bacterium]